MGEEIHTLLATATPAFTTIMALMIPIVRSLLLLFALLTRLGRAAPQDNDSDGDIYGQRYAPSAESLGVPRMGQSESSTPTFVDYNATAGGKDAYPAWSSERSIPLSKEEIEDIFLDLTQKFGFQRDSMRNMVSLTHFHRIPAC